MEIQDKIIPLIQHILDDRFEGEKRQLKFHHDRLNFACPYCGDSSDTHKKRGNFYWSNLRFSCFNGGCEARSVGLARFLKDYDQKLRDLDLIDAIAKVQSEWKPKQKSEFSVLKELSAFSVSMDVVERRLNLVPIEKSQFAIDYLNSRQIGIFKEFFRYSPSEKKIYIFNLDSTGKNAVGFQISRFTGPNKYISFNLEKLREKCGLSSLPLEKKDKLNRLSLYFGILRADFSQKVTIFEGFIDSLFIRNSIAITGIKKSLEELNGLNFRFMFDNDKDGIEASIKLLKKRKSIFMWSKALKEYGLESTIKDLNEMVINAKTRNKEIKEIDRYFTKDPNDLIYL